MYTQLNLAAENNSRKNKNKTHACCNLPVATIPSMGQLSSPQPCKLPSHGSRNAKWPRLRPCVSNPKIWMWLKNMMSHEHNTQRCKRTQAAISTGLWSFAWGLRQFDNTSGTFKLVSSEDDWCKSELIYAFFYIPEAAWRWNESQIKTKMIFNSTKLDIYIFNTLWQCINFFNIFIKTIGNTFQNRKSKIFNNTTPLNQRLENYITPSGTIRV